MKKHQKAKINHFPRNMQLIILNNNKYLFILYQKINKNKAFMYDFNKITKTKLDDS